MSDEEVYDEVEEGEWEDEEEEEPSDTPASEIKLAPPEPKPNKIPDHVDVAKVVDIVSRMLHEMRDIRHVSPHIQALRKEFGS